MLRWARDLFTGDSAAGCPFKNEAWPFVLFADGASLSRQDFERILQAVRLDENGLIAVWNVAGLDEAPLFVLSGHDYDEFTAHALAGTVSMLDLAWCSESKDWAVFLEASDFGIFAATPQIIRRFIDIAGGADLVMHRSVELAAELGGALPRLAEQMRRRMPGAGVKS